MLHFETVLLAVTPPPVQSEVTALVVRVRGLGLKLGLGLELELRIRVIFSLG